jgi:asparagine synthetase B (glutamine-hydrolysing)
MRGTTGVRCQPIIGNDDDSWLLFTGELYGGVPVAASENDAQRLCEQLSICHTHGDICRTIQQLDGEFALVYYSSNTNRIYFCRDRFGRKSLLFAVDKDDNRLYLSSVPVQVARVNARRLEWTDLHAGVVCSLSTCVDDGNTVHFTGTPMLRGRVASEHLPYAVDCDDGSDIMLEVAAHTHDTPSCSSADCNIEDTFERLSHEYGQLEDNVVFKALCAAVARRVSNCAALMETSVDRSLAILFSGGLDSSLIAACPSPNELFQFRVPQQKRAFSNVLYPPTFGARVRT